MPDQIASGNKEDCCQFKLVRPSWAFSWMLLQCIEVLCNRTLMMLSPLAPVPITLWGLFFRC